MGESERTANPVQTTPFFMVKLDYERQNKGVTGILGDPFFVVFVREIDVPGDSALVYHGLKQLQESCQPSRVRWPGGRSYKIAVNVSFGPIFGYILSSRGLDFGATCRVRRAFLSFEYACRSKNLRPMTNCCYRLVGGCKMTDHLQNPLVQAEVFWRPATGYDERIIGAWLDL